MSVVRTVVLSVLLAASAWAGGYYQSVDLTENRPTIDPDLVAARNIPMLWDERCIPVSFRVNDTLDPIPNPLGEDFLTLAEATAAIEQALDTWNAIPTSFIDMRLVGTTSNPGFRGFDMVNEITFRADLTPDVTGFATLTPLVRDGTLTAGADLDQDGDADVASGIAVCQDVDGDGDIEMPEGTYRAGTIVDSDIELNADAFRLTTTAEAADTELHSMDLVAAVLHELGHAHGLGHSLLNQRGRQDGTQATMYPFFDPEDPANELAIRSLAPDDLAWSSFLYREGSATGGPGALQSGDQAFDDVYGLITGEVQHGVLDVPVAGASVFAVDARSGEVVSSAISGHTQCAFSLTAGRCTTIVAPGFTVLDGQYTLPVPAGVYRIGIEASDGLPAIQVSETAQLGALLGQQNFQEEFYNGRAEAALEAGPQRAKRITVKRGKTVSGIDFVTNRTISIENFGAADFGTCTLARRTGVVTPPGRFYAVRVPAEQITQAGENLLMQGVTFFTAPCSDSSVTPVFAKALLTTGDVRSDGTADIELQRPLARVVNFVGQDNDFAPWYFPNARQLGRRVGKKIARGKIRNLFLVLELPTETPFPGAHGVAPGVALDGFFDDIVDNDDVPALGLSFISDDGGATFLPAATFLTQTYQRQGDFNIMFSLLLSESPGGRTR
jgi:hypothetical protein